MRLRTEFICRECGYRNPRSLGRCPECDAWSSFDEVTQSQSASASTRTAVRAPAARPLGLDEIDAADFARIQVPIEEFGRVMGGGVVRGSLTLVGGDPGVGKSTLLTQLAAALPGCLYVSGEESSSQVAMRARRLGVTRLSVLSETDAEVICETIRANAPHLVIVDSIQSVMAQDVDGLPGSVSQIRECAVRFLHLAKSTGTSVLLVGHVTKDGAIAGPKLLEHMVDTVLYLEGERFNQYRLLRSTKNRFGPTHEVGVFEMQGEGLVEVGNPSAMFLSERASNSAGSVVTVSIEGSRPILQEIQALVTRSTLAIPRRTATGFDTNRLHLLTAVLTRRAGLPLHDQDVYLNVVGGLRVEEPGADLAAALAIVSSMRDRALPMDLVAVGEVGLSGELRGVGQLEPRLREASKLGFTAALVPRTPVTLATMKLTPVQTLREAIRAVNL